jgi:zinc ribbon protein
MTCHKCGSETSPDQRFCRSCGARLGIVTEPLTDRAAISYPKEAKVIEDRGQLRNRLVACGFIIMFVGVAIGVIGKKLMHEEIVTVIGILMSLAGMFLTGYPYLRASSRKDLRSTSPSERELQKQAPPVNELPEGRTDYVPSITERTTDLLKSSEVRRSKEKDDETFNA